MVYVASDRGEMDVVLPSHTKYLPALLQAKELGNLLNLHRAVVRLDLPHHVRQSTSHPQTAFFDRDAYHKFNTS